MAPAMTAKERFLTEYLNHLETWGRNCGAPPGVYQGHLDILLRARVAAEEDRVAGLIEDEMNQWKSHPTVQHVLRAIVAMVRETT